MGNKKIKPHLTSDGSHPKSSNVFSRLFNNQRFLAIIGLLFLALIIFPLAKTYSQRRLVEKEIEDVQKQISDFESQNQKLEDLIAYLQSDQSLEDQARRNLNLKKPGEAVIIIEDEMLPTESSTSSSPESAGNLQKWWRYFFN